MIRIVLPAHLRTLAAVGSEVEIEVQGEATLRSVLDALEARYPTLRGTIRDQVTGQRRPFVRFFACGEDLSPQSPDVPLPEAVASGAVNCHSSRKIRTIAIGGNGPWLARAMRLAPPVNWNTPAELHARLDAPQ